MLERQPSRQETGFNDVAPQHDMPTRAKPA
jgi:hypothetical protein